MTEPALVREGRLKADGLRAAHGLGVAPIRDLFGFIERAFPGLFVVRYPMPQGPAGALIKIAERRLIVVNSEESPLARQRFTAAHELAHHLMDEDAEVLIDEVEQLQGAGGAHEVRANAFAVHLLVPKEVVSDRRDELLPADGESIVSLAMEYGISVQSLIWHASNVLGLSDSDRNEMLASARRPYLIARRMGLQDRVRQEMAAQGAIGWPRRYLSLLVQAMESGRVRAGELESWLEDPDLARELRSVPDEGAEAEVTPRVTSE